jgi:putative restriction endonuclease
LWNGRCAVTGADLIPILRSSHIKPWRDSNNSERLDVFNGLLLTPNYEAAFDQGLISFDDSGEIIFSKLLKPFNAGILGLIAVARLSHLDLRHRRYLQHHRSSVFEH